MNLFFSLTPYDKSAIDNIQKSDIKKKQAEDLSKKGDLEGAETKYMKRWRNV